MKTFNFPRKVYEALKELDITDSFLAYNAICEYAFNNYTLSDDIGDYPDHVKAIIRLATYLIDDANFVHRED